MTPTQNINLSSFYSLVVPVYSKQPIDKLLGKITLGIKNPSKKPIIHIISAIYSANGDDLNSCILELNSYKSVFVANGFIATAECIKTGGLDERVDLTIIDYATRLESTLLVDESFLKQINIFKSDLVVTDSGILFI